MAALSLTGGAVGVASHMAAQPTIPTEIAVGYSGDVDLSYDQVAKNLLKSMNEVDVGSDLDLVELHGVAANLKVSGDSRQAAQALLADPLLMNSVDAADNGRVDRVITARGLTIFAEQEPDSGAFTFRELESDLHQKVNDTSAFDYFDARGQVDQKFSKQELKEVVKDPNAPQAFREVAGRFIESPNIFNAFDVAEAAFSPTPWQTISGKQSLDGIISRKDATEVRYNPAPEQGSQWARFDREALTRIARGGEIDNDLLTAFHQTDRGNCVATAVIKSSLHHFGGQVLKSFTPNQAGGYDVVMRDGYKLSLTAEEMEAGATATHFESQENDTESYATLLFTSAAKRVQLEGHEGAATFGQALLSLNNGEKAEGVPHFLGLEEFVQPLELSQVPGQRGAVVHGGGHAYYVDTPEGQTLGDRYGKPTEYLAKSHINEGSPSTGAYIIVDA